MPRLTRRGHLTASRIPDHARSSLGFGPGGEVIPLDPLPPAESASVTEVSEPGLRRVLAHSNDSPAAWLQASLSLQTAVAETLATSPSVPRALQLFLDAAAAAFGFGWGAYWAFDSSRQQLRRLAASPPAGLLAPKLAKLGEDGVYEIGEGFPGRIALSRQAILIGRPIDYRWDSVDPSDLAIGIPVLANGEPLGALEFLAAESTPITDVCALLMTIASQLARFIVRKRNEQNALRLREEFIATAAHELKTPMTSLRGFAQLEIRRLQQNEEINRHQLSRALDVIDQQSGRLAHLVDLLVEATHIETGHLSLALRWVDLAASTQALVGRRQAGTADHTFAVQGPSEAWAYVDPKRIERAIANLLDNAVRFSPNGGKIDVEIDNAQNGAITIGVRDHGLGIPSRHREHIFDRYYRAHVEDYRSGLGIGLHVTRQIVELHGGQLSAQFPGDVGTRFIIRLPRITRIKTCPGASPGSADPSTDRPQG